MKIVNVRAMQPRCGESPADWRTTFGQILVAIDTDCGLTGYGVGGGGLPSVFLVRHFLRDILLQADPEPIGKLWDRMYSATMAFGRRGLAIMAISGVDLALWDLRGKAAGLPVSRLLSESPTQPVPAYGTFWSNVDEQELDRFEAFKLHIHPDDGELVPRVIKAVEEARRMVGDRPLMVDAWMRWDLPTTCEIASSLKESGVDWIEEPLSPDDLGGYAQLRDHCPLPIAGGEHEFTRFGFAPLIEQRLHSILQPDVSWCGGLTELIAIYRSAQNAGLRVCPHRGAEPFALPAVATLDEQPLAESGRPWLDWLGGQPVIENGTVEVSDRPGFGVIINEDDLKPVQEWLDD